ncbi:MAG: monovalent cation/H+ antiporter complex subunit F [Coriobacteriia bacterium]|nr:monovalent cation/H+ antiporter complex subunit F [Coriobacteriia bacterium]
MSDVVYVAFATVLLATIVVGLIRVERGPSPADRMLAAQLFGTSGVAMLLLLSEGLNMPSLRDVGLVFALLAAMTAVAFVKRAWHKGPRDTSVGEQP